MKKYNFWLEAEHGPHEWFFHPLCFSFFCVRRTQWRDQIATGNFMFASLFKNNLFKKRRHTKYLEKYFSVAFEKCTIINFSCFHFTTFFRIPLSFWVCSRNIHKCVIKQITRATRIKTSSGCVKWWVLEKLLTTVTGELF